MMKDGFFTYHLSSFTIHFSNRDENISWDDIESVFAHKVDRITIDDVYIDLIVNGAIIGVCEDIDGFDTFIENLQRHLPDIKDYWIVVQPAFATNCTILFDKFGRAQEEVKSIYYKN
jgi:hypothetical protein